MSGNGLKPDEVQIYPTDEQKLLMLRILDANNIPLPLQKVILENTKFTGYGALWHAAKELQNLAFLGCTRGALSHATICLLDLLTAFVDIRASTAEITDTMNYLKEYHPKLETDSEWSPRPFLARLRDKTACKRDEVMKKYNKLLQDMNDMFKNYSSQGNNLVSDAFCSWYIVRDSDAQTGGANHRAPRKPPQARSAARKKPPQARSAAKKPAKKPAKNSTTVRR